MLILFNESEIYGINHHCISTCINSTGNSAEIRTDRYKSADI